jgi:CRISPR-associated protein Cas1
MELQRVLYVTTEGSYLSLDHGTVVLERPEEEKVRVPLIRIEGICLFGRVSVSPFLIHACSEAGLSLCWLDRRGRFMARIQGKTSGNVLLRLQQYQSSDEERLERARMMVAAKLRNSRGLLRRAEREYHSPEVSEAADQIGTCLEGVEGATGLDELLGQEGSGAAWYFGAFPHLLQEGARWCGFTTRNRRPPLDPLNAMLSFGYTLLHQRCASALEAVGLDPQYGCLHRPRPGRLSLGLDLMEEMRSPLVDRLALTLLNRRELQERHFSREESGYTSLSDDGRKIFLNAWEGALSKEVTHRLMAQQVPWGLVPHVQARVLARAMRGDLPGYIPFVART